MKKYSFDGDINTGFYQVPQFTYRRVRWHDVKQSLKTFLTIMRDFLLIRSRSFCENSIWISTSSTSGCVGKRAQWSFDTTGKVAKRKGSQAYTNTTYSGTSSTKKRVRRSSSTKKKGKCACQNRKFKGRHAKNKCWIKGR